MQKILEVIYVLKILSVKEYRKLFAKKLYDIDKSNLSFQRMFKAKNKIMSAFPKIDDLSGFRYTLKDNGDIALTEYKLSPKAAAKKFNDLSSCDNNLRYKINKIIKDMDIPVKEEILIYHKDLK